MSFVPSYRNIWAVSYPLIVAGISETVVEVTDAIFLGRYGETQLAALGLAGTIYGLALFAIAGLADAIQIVIGRRVGQGDHPGVGRSFNQGLYLLAIVSALMIALIWLVLPLFTRAILDSIPLHQAVNAYLRIAAFGLLFHAANLAYSGFFVGIARTRVLIGATLVLALSNIGLDYALIFGRFGLPELGISGAGFASLGAELAAFVYITLDVLQHRYHRSYGLLCFSRWDGAMARHLITIGTPVGLETLVESGRWFVFFLIIERLGQQALAVATIVYSCYALFLIPVDAFSESVCSLVSNLLGQGRRDQLFPLIRRAMLLSLAGVLPALLLSAAAPDWVLGLFTPDTPLVEAALPGLLVVMGAALIAVVAEAFYATVAGTGDTWAVFGIQCLVSLAILAAAMAAFDLDLGLAWIWGAELLGWVVCLLLGAAWFRSGIWQRLVI